MPGGPAAGVLPGLPNNSGNGILARQHQSETFTNRPQRSGAFGRQAPNYDMGALPGYTQYPSGLGSLSISAPRRPTTANGAALFIGGTQSPGLTITRPQTAGSIAGVTIFLTTLWYFTHPQSMTNSQPYNIVTVTGQVWNVSPGVSVGGFYIAGSYFFNAGTVAGTNALKIADYHVYGNATNSNLIGTGSATDRTLNGSHGIFGGINFSGVPQNYCGANLQNTFSASSGTTAFWTGVRLGFSNVAGQTVTTACGLFIQYTSLHVTNKWGIQCQWTSMFGHAVAFGATTLTATNPGKGYPNTTRPVYAVTIRGSGNRAALGLRKTTSAPATSPPTGGLAIFTHTGTSTGHNFLCFKRSDGHYLYIRFTGSTATRQIKYSATSLPT